MNTGRKVNNMLIDEKLINYLEDLSFITLSAEERGCICADLKSIISGMELLSTLDTGSVKGQALNFKADFYVPALRKDEAAPSFPRSEILKNAPEANGETFVVPKTVE